MHAILGAAGALGEPLVALLGDPGFYRRFGFELSTAYEITPPRPEWQPHFQVRVLSEYQPGCAACSPTPNPSTGPETRNAVRRRDRRGRCPAGHDLTMPERQRRVVRYGVL